MRHRVASGQSKVALCGREPGRRAVVTHVGPITDERGKDALTPVRGLNNDCPACAEMILGVERALAEALRAKVDG